MARALEPLSKSNNSESSASVTEQLVDVRLVKTWLYWALAWLTIFPLVGLVVSIKFHNPDFLGTEPWFTFGRLRPVHVNGVIFGAFGTSFLGMVYYLVPRLSGRPMAGTAFSRWALWGWQLFLITGSLSFLFGYNAGFEADEFEWESSPNKIDTRLSQLTFILRGRHII